MGYQKKEDQIQKKRFYKVAHNVRKLMKSSHKAPISFHCYEVCFTNNTVCLRVFYYMIASNITHIRLR